MNLSTWFDQYRRQHARDVGRLRLVEAYSEAYALRETQPARAGALFAEARDAAERLQEPWWRLLYEKFRLDSLMHFQRDFREVLEPAWQLTHELESSKFTDLPEAYTVVDTLLVAYLGIDATGYPETIREALTHWDRAAPAELSPTHYLLLARRRQLAMEQERWEDAEDLGERELELASQDNDRNRAMHFSVFAQTSLCQLVNRRGDDEALGHAAGKAAEFAKCCGHGCEEAEAMAWLAVVARRGGQESEAQRLHRQAVSRVLHLGMPPAPGYFTALAAFHEQRRHFEAALDVRHRELATVRDRNRRLHECRVRVQICRLMALLGRPLAQEIELAMAAAAQVRCPDPYVEELGRLQAAA